MDQNVQSLKHKKKIKHGQLNKVQRKAYNSWVNQKQRCDNPNRPDYMYYGALGIRVEYSQIDFIKWYEEKIKDYPGKDPTVGRIDHNKNYAFNNIELVSFLDNRKERWSRKGRIVPNATRPKKVGLFSKKTSEQIAEFPSIIECGRFFGKDESIILRNCRSKNPKGDNIYSWYYRFV